MKEMTVAFTISYRWWRTDKENDILPHHVDCLKETAEARIGEMTAQGFTSGELHDNIFMEDTDIENGEDGISYRGWWEKVEKLS